MQRNVTHRCRLVQRLEPETCVLNQTFGCSADGRAMWTSGGCAGTFLCGAARVAGAPVRAPATTFSCFSDSNGRARRWCDCDPRDGPVRPCRARHEGGGVVATDVPRRVALAYHGHCLRSTKKKVRGELHCSTYFGAVQRNLKENVHVALGRAGVEVRTSSHSWPPRGRRVAAVWPPCGRHV